jgi:hypothetical protein
MVTVFWGVALCSVAEIGQCFRDGLLPPLSNPGNEGSKPLVAEL